jgi:hypothetical protein
MSGVMQSKCVRYLLSEALSLVAFAQSRLLKMVRLVLGEYKVRNSANVGIVVM